LYRRNYCYDPFDFVEGKDLKVVGLDPQVRYDECQGRCTTDDDCLVGLSCSTRQMGEYDDGRDFVDGCSGQGLPAVNYW